MMSELSYRNGAESAPKEDDFKLVQHFFLARDQERIEEGGDRVWT